MSLITELPTDPLRVIFDAAVAQGTRCHFCGSPLSLPIIHHRWMAHGSELYFHPACALELLAFLGADVKEALGVLNAHAALRRESSPRRPHPEVA